MRVRFAYQAVVGIVLICHFSVCFGKEAPEPADPNRYLNAVRTFADNVLKYGRDTYGPKHTPLFVDGLNIHTHEPVKWIAPNGDRWILSNLASQQNLFRTLDGLTRITGDPKYKQAAMDAIRYAFENLRSPNGLLYWGGHAAYDAGADRPCGRDVHELKGFHPYYELMWEVNPQATKQFIEAFWAGHIRNWSDLAFDRHSNMVLPLKEPWDHEYKGGPVFLGQYLGTSHLCTGSDLSYAAAVLSIFSSERLPLVWAKRLTYRYIETRDPTTGISAYIFTGRQTKLPTLQELKAQGYLHGLDSFFPFCPTRGDLGVRRCTYGYCNVSPGIPFNLATSPWISALLVGEMLGSDGKEFIQWSLEELTAQAKAAYRKSDNSWIPMTRDGSPIEGLIIKKTGFGPEGTVVRPIFAIPFDFWAYALVYHLTGDEFMWTMARNIALGNGFGDIGVDPASLTELKQSFDCADPYALLGFLELFKKTQRNSFLLRAEQIGNNILFSRFYQGFFLPSSKHTYARLNSPEALSLIHLYVVSRPFQTEVPIMWPASPFFEHLYRYRDQVDDTGLIYTLVDSPEPPLSLQEAAHTGDTKLVSLLLEKGARIDGREDSFYKTALHWAVLSGHKEVVELLLAKGANIEAQASGRTALHFAVDKGYKEIVEFLIANSANVNFKDANGQTPLYLAIMRGYKDIAELLINKGADINVTDNRENSLLHLAAQSGQRDMAELLIANGAEVNARNGDGQTPVDIALSLNRKDIVELLIPKGATVPSIHVAARMGHVAGVKSFLEKGTGINEKNNNGLSPLHMALWGGSKEVVKLLLAEGADIDARDKWGYTPLYYAIWNDNKDMVRLLVAKGTDVNVLPDNDGTPLEYAVWNEDVEMAKLFVAHGAQPEAKDNDSWTAFRYAASGGNCELVEFFVTEGADVSGFHGAACMGDLARLQSHVEQGADVNAQDEMGWTPLYWAASLGRTEVARLLIDKGADVRIAAADGGTALHQAVQAGDNRLVQLLLSNGADVKAKTKRGNTPLHSAASAGHEEVAGLLVAKGAEINAKTTANRTPLHSAVLGNHKAVVDLLIKAGADTAVKDRQGRTPLAWAEQRSYTEIIELLGKHRAKE